jgi:uncharacterized protein YcfJ
MAGNKNGGKKAAETTKRKYGSSFYAKIGALGGVKGTTGGFYARRDIARTAGAIGGRKSRRGPSISRTKQEEQIIGNIKQRFNIQ